MSLTGVAHELSRDFLVAAAAAEDLATESAVVAAAEGCELLIAVVALFTLAVWHPVLLQIAVLKGDNDHSKLLSSSKRHCMGHCHGAMARNIYIKMFSAKVCLLLC